MTDFLRKTGYFKSTPKGSPEDLEEMVVALRGGDLEMAQPIFDAHVRLVTAIARRWGLRYPSRSEDLLSEALLGLTQAIQWSGPHEDDEGTTQPSRLTHNNVTGYIITTVRRFLREFIERDRNVRMPGSTLRLYAASGRLDPDRQCNEAVVGAVFSSTREVLTDFPHATYDDNSGESIRGISSSTAYCVPEARQESPSPEFSEALELSIVDERHGPTILDLRSQGYTYHEVADRVGVSFVRVGQIVKRIEQRFDALYA